MGIFDKAVNFVDRLNKNTQQASDDIEKFTTDLRQRAESLEQSVKKANEENDAQAQTFVRQARFGGTGAKVGMWLAKPMNMLIAAGGVFLLVLGIRRFG